MVVNSVTERFLELGFTEYEARAYTALLSLQSATAYEAARESSIPTSKIYEVMEKLSQRGLVSAAENEGKKRYIPRPAGEFIESTRLKMDQTLDLLESDLKRMNQGQDISYIWNLSDTEALKNKAVRIIREARSTLLVSAWAQEAAELRQELESAGKRGVKISAVLFGGGQLDWGQVFFHPIEDTIYEEKGGRCLVIVADSKEALLATVQDDQSVDGAWSLNRGFVTLAEDYIKHDVYIMKIVQRMDGQLRQRFGEGYHLLRDIFSDQEVP